MVADFVRDHVGLREIAGRAEPARELVEERGVEIELAVGRAVERAGRRRRAAARRLRRAAEQHEPRRLVARAHRLEHGLPDVLGVAENGRDEVLRRILRRVGGARLAAASARAAGRNPAAAAAPVAGGAAGAAAFEHADHLQRIDAEDQARDHDDDERAAAEAHAAADAEIRRRDRAVGRGPRRCRSCENHPSACVGLLRDRRRAASRLQRPVEKRQAHVHPVVDVRMIVVEFLVRVANAGFGEPQRQDAACRSGCGTGRASRSRCRCP